MNPNGNDKIDQQLKAAAAQRREAQGAEFRPSDFQKEELLREVRSRWPAARPEERRGWWGLFAPRLAFAASLGAFALLVAGVLMRPPTEPASDEPALTLGREFKTFEADRTALDDEPQAVDAFKAEEEGVSFLKQAAPPPQPSPEAPRPYQTSPTEARTAPAQQIESRAGAESRGSAADAGPRLRAAQPEGVSRSERTLSVAPSPARRVAAPPAPRSLGLEAREQEQTIAQGASQLFFRQRSTNSRPLLDFFSFQQSGDQLSLTDSDGSVYQGVRLTAPNGGIGGGASLSTNVLQFFVEGTNETLRQKVTVRGAIAAAAPPSQSTARYALMPTNIQHVLRGTVQRQNQEPVAIEALSETPPPASVPTRSTAPSRP